MAFVRAGMDGDSVGAEPLGIYRCFYHIGVIASPAIAKGGKFVDIYGKLDHGAKVEKGG